MYPHYIVELHLNFIEGNFRVKGDTVDIYPGHSDIAYRIYFWGNEIEDIESIEVETSKNQFFKRIKNFSKRIFLYLSKELIKSSVKQIQDDLMERVEEFEKTGYKTE